MAMRRGRKLMGEINVVPYIDVMLVLLIIFMITAPLMSQGIKVELPKAGAEPLPPNARNQPPLILSVDRNGHYYLSIGSNQEQALDADTVTERVAAVLRREPTTTVLVKADTAVPYGQVVQGMVLLQRAGASQVGFVTDPATAADARRKAR
ncbi:MAG: protein TolR [Steroidobacteraceae bacterium]